MGLGKHWCEALRWDVWVMSKECIMSLLTTLDRKTVCIVVYVIFLFHNKAQAKTLIIK